MFCGRISECLISTLENFTTSAIFLFGKESLSKGQDCALGESWNGGRLVLESLTPQDVLGCSEPLQQKQQVCFPRSLVHLFSVKRKERKPLFLCCSQAENLLGLQVPHLGLRRKKTLHTCVQNSTLSLLWHPSLAKIVCHVLRAACLWVPFTLSFFFLKLVRELLQVNNTQCHFYICPNSGVPGCQGT